MFTYNSVNTPIQKLALEYTEAQKPYIFHHKRKPQTVSDRKFALLIQNIRKMIEDQIKPRHLSLEEKNTHYWTYITQYLIQNELENEESSQKEKFNSKGKFTTYCQCEIEFLENQQHLSTYDKIDQWIALLISNYKIFQTLQAFKIKLSFLFNQIDYFESQKYKMTLKSIKFLEDQKYIVQSELIQKYKQYLISLQQINPLRKTSSKQAITNETEDNESNQKNKSIQNSNSKDRLLNSMKSQSCQFIQYRQRRQTTFTIPILKKSPISLFQVKSIVSPVKQRSQIIQQEINLSMLTSQFKYKVYEPQSIQNKDECYQCKTKLKSIIFGFGNQNYCHYTKRWFCNKCIFPLKIQIPYKILKQNNLKQYSVCQRAYNEIKACYKHPIIQLSTKDLSFKNKHLVGFLLVKRQLQIMNDIICNNYLIQSFLKTRKHYLIKRNLLSIQNLFNIEYNNQREYLNSIYNKIYLHFKQCKSCKKKAYICETCHDENIIFPFEIKVAKYCNRCHKLYHRQCVKNSSCQCKNI